MKRYALIGGESVVVGIVENVSDAQFEALASVYGQLIEITDVQPQPQLGWSFDGQSIVGTSPSKKITKLAMRQRFTVQEMIGIMTASADPNKIIVRYLMDNLATATFVDLSRPDTQAGLQVLVDYGLITADRKNVILTTPPSGLEIYQG